MMQSEFFERTKVNLTSEEYARVEAIYNILPQMDKDEFCRQWFVLKDNPLIQKIAYGVHREMCRKQEAEQAIREARAQVVAMKNAHEKELVEAAQNYKEHIDEFGKRLIKGGEYDFPNDIYKVVEEEFGIQFIIKSKWEQSIELTETEIDYMVKKLN